MKHNFRGWKTVYGFTFRQSAKGFGFKLVTIMVTIVIIGLFTVVNLLAAKPDKADKIKISPVKTVYVLDNSGLQPTDFKNVNPAFSEEKYKNVAFIPVADLSRDDVIKKAQADSAGAIAVIITKKDTGYEIEAVVPGGSSVTKSQANSLLKQITVGFETGKLMQSGLTAQQLTTVLKPVSASFLNIGENNSDIIYAIKVGAPMLFGFMLYMMLILYGQTITKSVSIEKTSKLIETLLTSVHPYALITGKVLAVTSMALVQFVTWIIACFAGLYGGNAVAHAIYPDYQNTAVTAINFLKDNIGKSAMSLPSVIMAVLFFCLGFLFYGVLAGLAGCMVSKPEDAASTQGIFQMPVVISWLICYLAPAMGNEEVLKVARYIPFTSPFCVPVGLITGTIGLAEGLITLALLAVFTFFAIILSGRIYKGMILYNGQKVNLKLIGNLLKANK